MVSQPLSVKELVVAIFSDDSEAVTAAALSFPGAAAVVYIDAKSRVRKDKLMYIDLFGLAQGWLVWFGFCWFVCVYMCVCVCVLIGKKFL
jgi:hypothetical protein